MTSEREGGREGVTERYILYNNEGRIIDNYRVLPSIRVVGNNYINTIEITGPSPTIL